MASGVIKTEEWTQVNPIATVQGATTYQLSFYKKGKTLKVFGFVQPISTSHTVTITLNSDYNFVTQDFTTLRYSGFTVGSQICGIGTAAGHNITIPNGDFSYVRVDGILILE